MKRANCGTTCVCGARRRAAGWAFLAAAGCLSCPESSCRAAEISVSIHLDADSAEIIRGLRRANGIDPPDSAADQRLAEILSRARDRKRNPQAAAPYPVMQPLAPVPAMPTLRSEASSMGGHFISRVDPTLSQHDAVAVWIRSGSPRCTHGAFAIP